MGGGGRPSLLLSFYSIRDVAGCSRIHLAKDLGRGGENRSGPTLQLPQERSGSEELPRHQPRRSGCSRSTLKGLKMPPNRPLSPERGELPRSTGDFVCVCVCHLSPLLELGGGGISRKAGSLSEEDPFVGRLQPALWGASQAGSPPCCSPGQEFGSRAGLSAAPGARLTPVSRLCHPPRTWHRGRGLLLAPPAERGLRRWLAPRRGR